MNKVNYQYKIIVSNQNFYREYELSSEIENIRLGTTSACELRLNPDCFFEKLEVTLSHQEKWELKCPDELYISFGDIRKLYYTELEHGDVISVYYSESAELAFQIRFLIDFEAEVPKYDWYIDLDETRRIEIGDSGNVDLKLESEFGKNTLIIVEDNGENIVLTEKTSKYGVTVNGKTISKTSILKDCDFISVADFFGYYREKKLYFAHKNVCTNSVKKYANPLTCGTTYPKFVRNTRIKVKKDETPIKVLDPATIPTKPELNIVTSLMPTIAMFALIVVLRGVLSTTGGTFVLFSICSMGLGVVTSVISIFEKKKKYKKDCEERKTKYLTYIEKKKNDIKEMRKTELDCMRQQYYSTAENSENIKKFSSVLFDRTPEEADFLDVYLGVGTAKATRIIDYKEQEKLEVGDELCTLPGELAETYKEIVGAPVVVQLKTANAIGIVGEEKNRYNMMKNIMLDLVSRQYYGDLNIYLLIDENEKYEWVQLLPNIQTNNSHRRIVCDTESKNNVFEELYKELTIRSESKVQVGYNVVFVLEEHNIKNHPISRFIEYASNLNTVFIFFEPEKELLPLHCSRIIELDSEKNARIYESENKMEQTEFEYSYVSDEEMKKLVEILAPVYCDEISLEGSLKKSISLFELLGIYDVKDINLESNWRNSKIYESMAVPLGINVKNDIVYLDLHEKFHGPHGLVAGTTGSGKSEILQTFILGAATIFHPYEIGFVIIDFKGGGMVNQFKDLPHLVGSITNIDGKAIDRSLKSIKAELLKRQSLFAEADVNHIDKYIEKYKKGNVKTALPHLVIIVDEFAELKAEQPEFMKELVSAARIGRSLGVHLILATQKPAGQVNEQIWSNSKFRLCLKVQTQEDSNEVLKSPLAAEIREPGRAYLQVGNNEIFELLQSGFSGSPEKSEQNNQKAFDIYALDFKGNRSLVFSQKPKKENSSRTQLEAVVEYVNEYCKENNIEKLSEICLPALEEIIGFDNAKYGNEKNLEMSVSVGMFDDPDRQLQSKATVEIGEENLLIIGSAQYGKTNLLETIIRGLAENYAPDEVNIYIVDFASMVLKNFENLAHVGGVVCPSDDEKLRNLLKFLGDQIVYRREVMLSVGVSSFSAYKEAGYKEFPQIVFVIDNFTALKELYLQDNDALMGICREGVSVGITVVIANAQTSGLGYKYIANFAKRIAMFCNETSEYSAVFGACRMKPDEVPGRCLIEIEKTVYECQTFLAFEGEREIDRIQSMQKFVETCNERFQGKKAIPIPEIPKLLLEQHIYHRFSEKLSDSRQVLGIDYGTVSPISCEMKKNNLLAVCGGENSGKANFINYLINSMMRAHSDTEIYVFDNYKNKLSNIREKCSVYDSTGEQCKETLRQIDVCLQERYQSLIHGENVDNTWKMIVINNEDILQGIGVDKDSLAILRNITSKYRVLNVFVVLGSVPNAPVVYGGPEVYKIIKESRNIMFFDELENCKLIELPLPIVRKFKKRIELGDAYYIAGSECSKIKTPLVVK